MTIVFHFKKGCDIRKIQATVTYLYLCLQVTSEIRKLMDMTHVMDLTGLFSAYLYISLRGYNVTSVIIVLISLSTSVFFFTLERGRNWTSLILN